MSLSNTPLTLIVAATKSNGIGKNGALPWPMLKKEMAYFARVTKRVPQPQVTTSSQPDAPGQNVVESTRRNVVIMGRKTWESIPPRLRPLKDRTNIVISNQSREQLDIKNDDVIVSSSIQAGLQHLESKVNTGDIPPVGRAFIIGGTTIYRAAVNLSQTCVILLTRLSKEYDCDTTFPIDLEKDTQWQRRPRLELEEFVGESISEGLMSDGEGTDKVEYEFQLFQRLPDL